MSKTLKSLRVLFTNFIICIVAGHGAGPIILIELFSIYSLIFEGEIAFNSGDFPQFSLTNSYENMTMYFLLFSFLGQIVFLISYFKFFIIAVKKVIRFSGILLMLFGFFLITKNLLKDEVVIFTFVTGLPFLYFVFLEVKFFK